MNDNFYKRLIEEAPIGYAYSKIIFDQNDVACDYEFIEVNSAFETLMGINGKDIVGKKISELMPTVNMSELEELKLFQNIALNGGKKEFESYSNVLNCWFRITAFSPKKNHFIMYLVDVTKEKRQSCEAEVHSSQPIGGQNNIETFDNSYQKITNILDETNIATWKWNVQTGEIVFNKVLVKIIGYTFNQLSITIERWLEFIHPDDINIAKEGFHSIFNGQKNYFDVEYRMHYKNCRWLWINDKGKVISWTKDGKPLCVVGTYSDITERKQLQEKLFNNETLFASLLDVIPTPVFYKNVNGKYLGCNHAYEKFIGISKDKFIGKTAFDISPFELASVYHGKDLELFQRPGIQIYESQVKDGLGKIHSVVFNKATITNQRGELSGLIGIILDITEQKQIEEALKSSEEKYRLIFENTPLGVLHFDNKGIITDCNDNLVKIIGSSRADIIGLDMHILSDKMVVKAVCESLKGQLSRYEGDYQSLTSNKITPMRVIFAPILLTDQSVKGGVGIVEDISQRKKLEIALSNEKNLLETTLVSVGDGVISTDNKGYVVFLNKVAEHLTGWTQEEARNKSFEEVFRIVDEFTGEKKENIVDKVISSGKIIELANHTMLISKDGIQRPIEDSAAPIIDKDGEINGVVLVFRDVTDKKEKQKRILYLSYHDQLTGLYNRRFYDEELTRLDNKANLPLTIALGDVNGLKLINDSFGHIVGDELLIKVANVIKSGCRSHDIVARLGGDEFVMIFPRTDGSEAHKIIKRINKLASKEIVGSIGISISFGYDTKYVEEDVVEDIFKKAEDRMYKKKLSESPSVRGKTIDAIISTLYEKNEREEKHSRRVSELCRRMGSVLYANESEIEELKTVGLLHDIGKIVIDQNILNNPNKLTNYEVKEMQRHTEIGYRILNTVNDMADMAVYVLHHHERWDGKGYPQGLKGNDIPFVSRIIAIADAYDAMTSERCYRHALSKEKALDELRINAGSQFDPELVNIFIEDVLEKTT
ncbi:PAS domain S-box protein [Paludicola sp. MB14-C6]|uniref:PAS domain S-box protein n=1 Tax=Paludihabitans sp. MB14-C6 TaxID=3070656 RepID=UPI0027DBA136|nr:PAS domain S-box protein [Paludicola sp. MB14-C6]WMJ22995.1 PAS domain S-box protein [Paludicola sp. MB14-C6]